MHIKLFGTDGIRGEANSFPITPNTVQYVAMASAQHFMGQHKPQYGQRFTVVIGKDTRLSGYMVENALVSGFVAMGANVFLLGPVPTPAVAFLTRSLRADLGVMVSASHNPYTDNGLKMFGPESLKISSADEQAIEMLFIEQAFPMARPEELGRAKRLEDAAGRYIELAKSTFPKGQRLDGLRIVVDCAHGATHRVAPRVFWELGAEVISIGVEPDGRNINKDCGATSPSFLQHKVLEVKADLGVALDGDGDRLLLVDEKGSVMNGDHIIALIAKFWYEAGRLQGQGIVGTQMSNLGLERYLDSMGLMLYRSSVGDRHVIEMMEEKGCNVGGEQSGHIILKDYATTGDGIIAALQALSLMRERNLRPSDVSKLFKSVPQVLKNVRVHKPLDLEERPLKDAISEAQSRIGGSGRLLVRASGTEPVVRLMAQGDDEKLLKLVVHHLGKIIQSIDQRNEAA